MILIFINISIIHLLSNMAEQSTNETFEPLQQMRKNVEKQLINEKYETDYRFLLTYGCRPDNTRIIKNFETVEELYIESMKDAYTNILVFTVRYDVNQKKAERIELTFTPPPPSPTNT